MVAQCVVKFDVASKQMHKLIESDVTLEKGCDAAHYQVIGSVVHWRKGVTLCTTKVERKTRTLSSYIEL